MGNYIKTTFPNTEEKNRILSALKWIGIFFNEEINPHGNPLNTLCAALEKGMQSEEGEKDFVMLQHKFEMSTKMLARRRGH
jgi:saccharopine dehydrogenase (NADP+, L-glutamate forming)